jgi:hypothetical protein
MEENNVIVQGLGFEISEDKSNPDYLNGRFCICDFDINKNNVSLNRETIDEWVSTLVGTPLVAKITKDIKGKQDFGSHEMRVVATRDKNGKVHKKAIFDTSAFGVCTSVSIDTAEDGNDYIYADYKIWKRFENACKIVQERADNLHTSWEICTEEFTQKVKDGRVIKQIDKGRFIGLAMLSKNTPPAYDSSGLLEVASEQEDELNIALMEDLENLNVSSNINFEDKEVKADMEKNTVDVNVSEQTNEEVVETVAEGEVQVESANAETAEQSSEANVETVENVEGASEGETQIAETNDTDVEVSALTERDLRFKLEKAFEQADDNGHCTYGWMVLLFPADNTAWFKECCRKSELDLVEVKYTVENDNVTITEKNPVTLTVSPREINQVVAQKDNAIVEMSNQIKTLNDTVAQLQPYKDKVDEIEKAEKEAQIAKDRKELSDYALSSGYITKDELETSEEIKGYIENLDKASIKSLIADRVVASLANKETKEVETSETNVENNEESNIQLNLSAEKAENKKDDSYAFNAIKSYIGR